MKIKFFTKEKKFGKEKESPWLNMNFYWNIAVCFLFIVILLSSFFGYYLFSRTNKESVGKSSNNSSQIQTIQKERIDKVLEYFSVREQKSSQILYSPSPIIDPSL